LVLGTVLSLSVGIAQARVWDPAYEAKVGKEALDQVKKEYKVYDSPEDTKRIAAILSDLAASSTRPDVKYQVFLLDTTEENAFSLPGGYVCVTKALLANSQSNDELAAVLAHEMAHNCNYDALEESRRAEQMTVPVLAAVVAAMITGKGGNAVANTFMAGMYVANGIMSTYSVKVENQADSDGLNFMLKCGKYNPVGMLTFMERLAAQERSRPPQVLGIFQTHPFSVDRVVNISDRLAQAGVTINRRAVTKWDPPVLTTGKLAGGEVQTLSLWKHDLFSFNAAPGGGDVAARGAAMVKALTAALASGAETWEFYVDTPDGHPTLTARGQTLVVIYPEDAQLNGTTPEALAAKLLRNLNNALFAEQLDRLYDSAPFPPATPAKPSAFRGVT
jgi:Zn-dependent protease with chaperone function